MSDDKVQNSIITFVVGVGVGALIGILFAPRSGEETRESLRSGARDAVDAVSATGQRLSRTARRAVSDTADQMRNAVDDTTDRLVDALGDTTDRLRNAVEEGERAYTQAKRA